MSHAATAPWELGRALAGVQSLRVALVHDWLTGMRGGEKCLEVFCELLPQAEVFTLFHLPGSVSPVIERHRIHASALNRIAFVRARYRHFLPLFPRAMEAFDLSRFDLIVSLSHCVAKGAGRQSGVPHLSYCFTPMRYLWDQSGEYFNRGRQSAPALFAIDLLLEDLRRWDRAIHPAEYVAISRFVAARMRRVWGVDGPVVHPPVDLDRFSIRPAAEDFYLVVSALTPYKRIDIAVEAANRLGRRLLIAGNGEDHSRLRRLAGPTVELLGWRSDGEVADLLSRCRALLLPGEEDFGIAPLEAMACGRPVLALGRGGALETVVDLRAHDRPGSATGVLFPEATPASLAMAMTELEARQGELDAAAIRAHAGRFARPRFRDEIARTLVKFVEAHGGDALRSRLSIFSRPT